MLTDETALEAGPVAPGLRWAIKRSFVNYVFRMPDGGGWATDGASAVEGNVLVYELVGCEATDTGGQRWAFRGDVRFSGHGGVLFVRIADPVLTIVGNNATLSVLDPYQENGNGARIDLVTVELSLVETADGLMTWTGDPVRLTAAGVKVFNDVYAEGDLFEPLVVHLPPTATNQTGPH